MLEHENTGRAVNLTWGAQKHQARKRDLVALAVVGVVLVVTS